MHRDCRSETASVVWLSGPASVSAHEGSAAAALPGRKAYPRLFCRRSLHFNQLRLPLTRLVSGQGSLAPSRLDRNFTATMSPSDTAVRSRQRLWLPALSCPRRTPNRVSQVPAGSFSTRCLLPPRGVRSVHLVVSSRTDAGFTSLGRLASPIKRNEAEPSSRTATARAFAALSLSEQGRPLSLRVWLHDSRPIITANSFQLTRTNSLSWRFPN